MSSIVDIIYNTSYLLWLVSREKGPLSAIVLALLISFTFLPSITLAQVADTKHNLGSYSPGTVKALASTEICIFCHTPHTAAPEGPIWNRSVSGETYTIYGTTTMVANTGVPTGSSKLCLSCHDGSIAIGSLLNLPGMYEAGILTMEGVTAQGKMDPVTSAYIGSDLTDDHPISFDYNDSVTNTEIVPIATLQNDTPELELDGNDNVQCTTCHDPHGTAFDMFLEVDVDGALICTKCHVKLYWDGDTPIHSTDSTTTWNGTDPNPWDFDLGLAGYTNDTLSDHQCMACHRSHGGAPGISLTKGDDGLATPVEFGEEWLCLNCHNGNVTSVDMTPYFDQTIKNSEHPVMFDVSAGAMYNLHKPDRATAGSPAREAQGDLDNNNRHSECVDCHNAHGAKAGNHTRGGTTGFGIGNNLIGGWGVKPTGDTWPSAGTAISTSGYTVVDFSSTDTVNTDIREGHLCMKCHSSYAYDTLVADRPDVPSGNASSNSAIQSQLSLDFNPNNYGYHPVFAAGANKPPNTANTWWTTKGLTDTFWYTDWSGGGSRTGYYRVEHTSTINCSDCHGSDSSGDLQGPHGSTNKYILKGNETGIGTSTNVCYNCHRRQVYGDDGFIPSASNAKLSRVDHPTGLSSSSPFYQTGATTGNNSNGFGNLCLTCHGGFWDTSTTPGQIKGIHGSNAAAGAQGGSDPLGYRLMNGACVESYKRPTSSQAGQIWFVQTTDDHCKNVFSSVTITYSTDAHYDCSTIADCSN